MRTERVIAAISFALVTLGIAAAALPARGMTLRPVRKRRAGGTSDARLFNALYMKRNEPKASRPPRVMR